MEARLASVSDIPTTTAKPCQAFDHYDRATKKHLQCGAGSSFIRRRQKPTQATEDWDGEPFYLCDRHAAETYTLVVGGA